MIKVLHIVPSMHYGGVGSVVMNYYRNLSKDKIHIDFATFHVADDLKQEMDNNGSKVYHLENRSAHPIKRFNKIRQILKENDYDIVHAHSDSASLFLDLFAAKVGGNKKRIAHSHNTMCLVKWQHVIFKPLLFMVVNKGIACSKDAGIWMFGDKPFTVLNNGIDYDLYCFNQEYRQNIRDEFNWHDRYVIGNVGNYQPSKNQIFLVRLLPELIKKNKNIKLALVGSCSDEAKKYVEENKLDDYVEFVGVRNDVNKLLQGMDMFVFPSLFEGNAVAVTEAYASGLPCLMSDAVYEVRKTDDDLPDYYHLPLVEEKWIDFINNEIEKNNVRTSLDRKIFAKLGYDIKELGKELEKIYEDLAFVK